MSERERIIAYLVDQGHEREFATYVVDHEQGSLLFASARFMAAFRELGLTVRRAFGL